MKKVIVRLGNGLGNQLFTYAAAYSFARRNNAELYVDDESGFLKHKYKYELNHFNISAPIVEKNYKFLGFFGRFKRNLLIKLSMLNKKTKFLIEKKDNQKLSTYDKDQLNINFHKVIYFEGYFQSEKYYKAYINDILKEFTFKNEITNQKNSFVEDIKKSNSISIHLRQDKFQEREKHKNRNILNLEFFEHNVQLIKKGIQYFDKKLDNPKYFIWSEDFSQIKNIFTSDRFTYVDANHNKDPAYDLYLMSLCKHFILSPSSMHYWGALLSKNTDKICLAPLNVKNRSGYYGFSNNKDIKAEWWFEI